MASIKDDREESDGDEMEHESGDSDKSSSTSDSSDDGSDTDDSSELDVEECEQRRNDCVESITNMERQFVILREQLYRERIAQIKTKLEEVHEGTAPEYTQPAEELQENMRMRIEVAGNLKKMRLESIEENHKAEEKAARENFENEKQLLFDSMKEELEEKLRKLEEERNNVEIQSDSFFNTEKTKSGKGKGVWKKGLKSEPGRKKPVTVSGPYIVYMLSEADILEDWTIIKKAITSSKRNSKSVYHRYL